MRANVAAAVLLVLLSQSAFAGQGKINKKKRPIEGSYMVMLDDRLKPDVHAIAHQLATRHGGRITALWEHALRGFAIEIDETGATAIARDPRVLIVEEDELAEIIDWCHGSCYGSQTQGIGCGDGKVPWQLDRLDGVLDDRFQSCPDPGWPTVVYVIDSGIRMHPDLRNEWGYSRVAEGISFVGEGTNTNTDDCDGHGTIVASLIVGTQSGAAKSAPVVPVRVLDCEGRGNAPDVISAINWVIQQHDPTGAPAVANISLNFSYSPQMNAAVDAATADGVVVVVGAGNTYGSNNCASSPASAATAITVGASTKIDTVASFSSTGPCVDIFAPGAAVGAAHWNYQDLNCNPGWSGTSYASAVAAGVAAVLVDAHYYDNRNYASPDWIKQIIVDSSAKNYLSGVPSGTPNRLLQMPYGSGNCQPWEFCLIPCEDCNSDSGECEQ